MGVRTASSDMETNRSDSCQTVSMVSRCAKLCSVFDQPSLRRLYAVYTRRTRRDSPAILILISILTSLSSMITSSSALSGPFLPHFIISGLLIIVDVIFYVLYTLYKSKDGVVQIVMYAAYVTMSTQIVVNWLVGEQTRPVTDSLDWLLVAIYAILVLIPLFLYQCLIMATICTTAHLVTSSLMATNHEYYDVDFSATLVSNYISLQP